MAIKGAWARRCRAKLYSVSFARCYNAVVHQSTVILSAAERRHLHRVLNGLEALGQITLGTIKPLVGPATLTGFLSSIAKLIAPHVVDAVVAAAAEDDASAVQPPPLVLVPIWQFEAQDADANVLMASGQLLGAEMLCEALRVHDPDDPQPVAAVRERFSRWRSAMGSERPLATVRVPGWPGDYVVFCFPHPL